MATKKKELAPGEKKKPHGLCGKPSNGKNSPVIGMNGYNLEPGDNTKVIELGMKIMNLPDIDMKDAEQVAERIGKYFELYAQTDLKPTVSGLALSLNGMSRQTLWAIANDQPLGSSGYKTALPTDVSDVIKKAYKFMEFSWENNFGSGKLNPVTGIFLGKNHFNYHDKQEHVLTPNTRNDSDYNADDIKQRYLVDSTDSEG
jgi:hypothetical protein